MATFWLNTFELNNYDPPILTWRWRHWLVDCRNGSRPTKRCLNGGILEWPHVTITPVIANVYCGQYGTGTEWGCDVQVVLCCVLMGWRDIGTLWCCKTGLLATASAALQRPVHTAATFPLRRSKTVSLQVVARRIFGLNWALLVFICSNSHSWKIPFWFYIGGFKRIKDWPLLRM